MEERRNGGAGRGCELSVDRQSCILSSLSLLFPYPYLILPPNSLYLLYAERISLPGGGGWGQESEEREWRQESGERENMKEEK